MRNIIVLSFVTIDGVMQAPGGPDEDTSGGFEFGGWVMPYFDEAAGELMDKQMKSADLLLGRKTFDIFEAHWPQRADEWKGINDVTKYAVSTTRKESDWNNTVFLSGMEEIKKLKQSDGGDLQVHGSGKLIQSLVQNDLVDEMWLKIFPLTLGKGKKLFAQGTIPVAFELIDSTVTPAGVIFANYKRVGKVKTGTIGE